MNKSGEVDLILVSKYLHVLQNIIGFASLFIHSVPTTLYSIFFNLASIHMMQRNSLLRDLHTCIVSIFSPGG